MKEENKISDKGMKEREKEEENEKDRKRKTKKMKYKKPVEMQY